MFDWALNTPPTFKNETKLCKKSKECQSKKNAYGDLFVESDVPILNEIACQRLNFV